jgi:hypothetical protein
MRQSSAGGARLNLALGDILNKPKGKKSHVFTTISSHFVIVDGVFDKAAFFLFKQLY